MSFTVTMTGKKSVLESHFQPPLNLSGKYECGLLYFSVLNSVHNITCKNNIFAYGEKGKILKIPCGFYDLFDLSKYLQSHINDCEIKLKPNNNTLTCSLYCSKIIHFETQNSIAPLLGFPLTTLEANKWHESEHPVNILPLSIIRIECDLVSGSYNNGSPSHVIYEFVPNVAAGHKYIEVPRKIIYLPVNKSTLTTLTVRVLDDFNNCINFGEENIQLRLHLRKSS